MALPRILGYELRGALIGFTLKAERVVTKHAIDCKPVVCMPPRKAPKRYAGPVDTDERAWATPRSEDSARAVAAFKKGSPIYGRDQLGK
jgi:hypothetical protein